MDPATATLLEYWSRTHTFFATEELGEELGLRPDDAQSTLERLREVRAVMRTADGRYSVTPELFRLVEGGSWPHAPLQFEPSPSALTARSLADVKRLPGCSEVVSLIEEGPVATRTLSDDEWRARGFTPVRAAASADLDEIWGDRTGLLGKFRYSVDRYFGYSRDGSDKGRAVAAVFEHETRSAIEANTTRIKCGHYLWSKAGIALGEWAAIDLAIVLYARAWAGPTTNTFADQLLEAYQLGGWPCGWTSGLHAPYPHRSLMVTSDPHLVDGKCCWDF